MAQQSFLEYIDERQSSLEDFLNKKNALVIFPEKCESIILGCYKELMLVYKIQQKPDKFLKILHQVNKFGYEIFTSEKNEEYAVRVKNNEYNCEELKSHLGFGQFTFGTYLILAHEDLPRARELFEWAIVNCTLSDEYYTRTHSSHKDIIAFSYLWKGYSLLSLERYAEAYDCLMKVAPVYQVIRKTGREMRRVIEYTLTKALIPLCEFRLNPTKDNLKKAQKGVEEYINSVRDNKFKLEGYVYYFHLKEQFADVYNADPKKNPEDVPSDPKLKLGKIPGSPPELTDTPGSVIILDPGVKSNAFAIIGTNGDFDRFIRYVTNLGDFPELASLMDLYTLGNPQEAKQLEVDCSRFIRTPGIDPDIYEIGKKICSAIRVAAREDSEIVIEYQEELDPDTPE
jgi:tetratricopeptide (TPR) repeat protein